MIINLPDNLNKYYVHIIPDYRVLYIYIIHEQIRTPHEYYKNDLIVEYYKNDLIFFNSFYFNKLKNNEKVTVSIIGPIYINQIDEYLQGVYDHLLIELLNFIKQYLLFL